MRTVRFECPNWLVAVSDRLSPHTFYRMASKPNEELLLDLEFVYGSKPVVILPGVQVERQLDETRDDTIIIRAVVDCIVCSEEEDLVIEFFGFDDGDFIHYLVDSSVFEHPMRVSR